MRRHDRTSSHTFSHSGSSRFLATLTGFALALSLAPTAWATSTDRITANDGQTIVVNDDVERTGENERGVLAKNLKSTEVPTTVEINGNVSATGSFRAGAAEAESSTGCETKVTISGNAFASSPHQSYGTSQLSYGTNELYVGGDIETTLEGESKYEERSSTGVSASSTGEEGSCVTTIEGDVKSTSTLDNSIVDGVILNASSGAKVDVSVKGDVNVTVPEEECQVTGITTDANGGSIDLEVGGSVIVSTPSQEAKGIFISDGGEDYGKQANVVVHIGGDVISNGTGIMINAGNNHAKYDIIIEGILKAETMPIAIVNAAPTIEIAVSGISSPLDEIAFERGEDGQFRPTETSRAFAAAINYLVKIDSDSMASKQVPGGSISVLSQDGSALKVLGDYSVVRPHDIILVRVTPDEGLVVDRVFNGEGDERVELVQDGEGNYILEVPASGNINLSALFRQEETPEPEPEPAPTPEPTPAPVPSVDPAPARATSPAQKALPATGDESAAWGVTVTALGGCLVIAGALCRLRSTDEEAA